jgi:hypothetical protein
VPCAFATASVPSGALNYNSFTVVRCIYTSGSCAGVGPEHSHLKASGRAQYVAVTDKEALEAIQLLSRCEGIIPALEPAHAIAHVMKLAPTMGPSEIILLNMCGRGDKVSRNAPANSLWAPWWGEGGLSLSESPRFGHATHALVTVTRNLMFFVVVLCALPRSLQDMSTVATALGFNLGGNSAASSTTVAAAGEAGSSGPQ